MKKIFGLAFIFTTSFATAALAAPERVRGTVSSINSTQLVVHTASGDETVKITSATHFLKVENSTLSKIVPGSFIGTATKTVGMTQEALEVVIFPPSMKGTGEGHYGWDKINDTTMPGTGKASSSMTNGTVASVTSAPTPKASSSMTNGTVSTMTSHSGSKKLTVTYNGGQQIITVPQTAPIVMFAPGEMSDVAPGTTVFVNGITNGQTVTAKAVAVGVDGATPPM